MCNPRLPYQSAFDKAIQTEIEALKQKTSHFSLSKRDSDLQDDEGLISSPHYSAAFKAFACPENAVCIHGNVGGVISGTMRDAVIFSQHVLITGGFVSLPAAGNAVESGDEPEGQKEDKKKTECSKDDKEREHVVLYTHGAATQ